MRSHIDRLKQEKDRFVLEELEKQVKRVSIRVNYEQMVERQKVQRYTFVNWCHFELFIWYL